jgi:hypothetical protein
MKVAKYWSCQKPKMAEFMTKRRLIKQVNAVPKHVAIWVDKGFRGIEMPYKQKSTKIQF